MVKAILSVLTFITVFSNATSILNQDDAEKNAFHEWKRTFRRNYTSTGDEQKAMKNLLKNKREIEFHNIRFKAGMESYSRGLWELSDLTFEEKTEMLAGSKLNLSQLTLQGPMKRLEAAPAAVNWVTQGRVNSVQNQGRCGSCFAFTVVGTVEGVALKKGIQTRFSVQQIVDCDKMDDGCSGGDPMLAFRYVKLNGLTSAAQYPYTARQGTCKQQANSPPVITSATRERLNGNENRLKEIVANYGPVSVAINAAKSLTNYKSGVYQNPQCSKAINHAVLLVGYGYDQKTKLDYWLVKNSWGTSWGESGYVKMARNKGSLCGIASEVIYAM